MKNAIILHGTCSREEYMDTQYPCGSNFHWLPWLQKQLLVRNIFAVTPQMPEQWMPNYDLWKREFERHDVSEETILVGHSCGGGFLVRWLSENPDVVVGTVVLVAPWMDPNKTKGEDNEFFDFTIDTKLKECTNKLVIFNSTDDSDGVHKTVTRLRNEVENIEYREFENYGHFCLGDLGAEEFPELLEEILRDE